MRRAEGGAGAVRRFRRDENGAVAVVAALMLTVLCGMVALAVETGMWFYLKRDLQTAVDSAALGGALELTRGNAAGIRAAGGKEASRNGFVPTAADALTLNWPPKGGVHAGDADYVEAIGAKRQSFLLSGLLSNGVATIEARAVAFRKTTGEACVLALDHLDQTALLGMGNTTINMPGCVVASNSISESSIDLTGSSDFNVASMYTAGDIALGGSSNLTTAAPPVTKAPALPDPYRDLMVPALASCTPYPKSDSTGITRMVPGTYCGDFRPNAQETVLMQPGTYYLDRGNLDIGAQVTVRCACVTAQDGVTIVLTSSGDASQIGGVTINGGASVELRAPSGAAAPYRGVVLYQDRRAPVGAPNKFNGGGAMNLAGAVYFPAQNIEWSGNSETVPCTQIVAYTVKFTGNSEVRRSGCQDVGVRPIRTASIELVE